MKSHTAKRSVAGQLAMGNPFDLADSEAYEQWKQWKLRGYPADAEDLVIKLENPYSLQPAEIKEINERCAQCNMVIYQLGDATQKDKTLVHELGVQLGLTHLDSNLRADEDSVTSLEVREQAGNQYIPYTNKPLSWHTDGYYNRQDQQIRAIIMHCVSPSAEGGVNFLLDHELLYIRLRDENPEWIRALMYPEAMVIPPNIEEGRELRGERIGPIFSVDPLSKSLHMRYSARKKNIEWRDEVNTLEAAARITELLGDESLLFQHRLQAGQGVISNNVLHSRTAFNDTGDTKRLLYRARYFDRIAGTYPPEQYSSIVG
jgi:alpha-ketoglutarate-dependent taurine dioxygenase